MARRKTVVARTGAELAKQEYRTDARKDAPRRKSRGLLPTLAEWRETRGMMSPSELLKLARAATRLELRGSMYSADDRQDVAAAIVAAVLADTGGAMPRNESPRITLGRLCGDAKNLRRSIDAGRERDRRQAEQRAAEHAQTAAALGADPTPAKHAAIVARASVLAAERAASAICAELGLPADMDGAAWSVFYQWARGATGEVCAAERGCSWASWKMRQTRGAKFVRGFYGAAELMSKLTLGAMLDTDGVLVFTLRDDSRECGGRHSTLSGKECRAMWGEWREKAPQVADVTTSKLPASERVHWRRRRENRRDHATETAAALGRIGQAYARTTRRERAAARKSHLLA